MPAVFVAPALMPALAFPDEIAATPRAHLCGMRRARGNIAAFPCAIRARLAALHEGHFAIEDNVRGFNRVRVVRVKGLRSVLPDVGVRKSLAVQLAFQRFLIGGHFWRL
jgi:hypothetical protein